VRVEVSEWLAVTVESVRVVIATDARVVVLQEVADRASLAL
jgi:hypothetical protein